MFLFELATFKSEFDQAILANFHHLRNRGEFDIMSRGHYATLAQLVEHLTRNEKVAGSIPAGGSTSHLTPTSRTILRSSSKIDAEVSG